MLGTQMMLGGAGREHGIRRLQQGGLRGASSPEALSSGDVDLGGGTCAFPGFS